MTPTLSFLLQRCASPDPLSLLRQLADAQQLHVHPARTGHRFACAAPAPCETPLISDTAMAQPSGWFHAQAHRYTGVSPDCWLVVDPH